MSCSICDPTLWAGSLVLMYAMRRIFNSRHRSLLGKVVVVTGCDSGFGELTAQKFAALGCTVYAGVLLAESKKRFEQMAISNLKPFLLDVTKPESIAAMKAMLLKDNASLKIDVLVNNAGIAEGWLVEFTSMAQYRQVMEVNFFGIVEITKTLLPYIRAAKGRVINLSSVAGLVSGIGFSAYGASKFALEAFSDSLRRESALTGVKIVLIEPFFMRTRIIEGRVEKVKRIWEDAGEDIQNAIRSMQEVKDIAGDPNEVVDVIVNAAAAIAPRARYVVGFMGWGVLRWLGYVPTSVADKMMGILLRR